MPRRKDNPQPWERQIGEGFKPFAAFENYLLDGPDRGIRKTARAIKRDPSQIAAWSGKYHWLDRAHAWDDKLAEERRLDAEVAIQKMHARHAALAMKVQAKVNEALDKMDKGSYPKGQLANALARATEIERMARGEPANVEEIREKNEPDYSQLSNEALEKIGRVIRDDEDQRGAQEGDPEKEPPQVH